MTSTHHPANEVIRIVSEICARDLDPSRDASENLRDLGVSSLKMIQLIGDLEGRFDIRIRDDEIGEENFGSLGGLIRFVEGKAKS